MICRSRRCPIPEELSLAFLDRHIVDAGVAVCHQAVLIEQPVLVAVGAEPLTRIVVVFIGKADRDTVGAVRPHLLDEAVLMLAAPLVAQEVDDLSPACHEHRAIAPDAVDGICLGHELWIATIPRVFSANRAFSAADSSAKGGTGGLSVIAAFVVMVVLLSVGGDRVVMFM